MYLLKKTRKPYARMKKMDKYVTPSIVFVDVYPDCHEIKLAKMDKNPLRNNLYAIDPDGSGGEKLFSAFCDFKTNEKIGITEVWSFLYLRLT